MHKFNIILNEEVCCPYPLEVAGNEEVEYQRTMSLGPFLRLPFTDLTGCAVNHQQYDKCGKLEMEMVECLEAYGVDRGQKKCADLIADFQECSGMKKQLMRIHAMRLERLKQYYKGERSREELYAPPPRVDAY